MKHYQNEKRCFSLDIYPFCEKIKNKNAFNSPSLVPVAETWGMA
jgi:hypothetical protein